MKPPPFEYHVPGSLEEALEILGSLGADALPLAGGQSLVPLMNLRLARPAHIVDINRIEGFNRIDIDEGRLSVGPLVRHSDMERSPEVRGSLPIVSQVVPFIGYPAIRHRGTVAGSLAHADPAAEWPCLALGLDAEITLSQTGSSRTVEADRFFKTMLTTVREPNELLTKVSFRTDFNSLGFYEFARRHGDFAIIAAMVAFQMDGDTITSCRVSLAGAADRPVRVREAEDAVTGRPLNPQTASRAGAAVVETVDPLEDIHGSADYRRELAGVAVERAIARAGEWS
ncbi:MAG: xanthine dehydrogenase family protein subunit M [Acidimicrobiia bacterium]|nr:xanthine dehydrogenase family protein subunit M [Acidimicrobiia bacterium]